VELPLKEAMTRNGFGAPDLRLSEGVGELCGLEGPLRRLLMEGEA